MNNLAWMITNEKNKESGILNKSFSEVETELKAVIEKLGKLTEGFVQVPPSEKAQEEVFEGLKDYNRLLSQLKQYTKDDEGTPVSAYEEAEAFYQRLGISEDEEVLLTTVIAGDLKERRAKHEEIDISQVDLAMVHIHEVKINYDYLVELIAKMADEVHADQMDDAANTRQEIDLEIAKNDNEKEKNKVRHFVSQIFTKAYVFDHYPAPTDTEKNE
ncbi:hypothetical protein ICE98_00521 [Lactococcus lactis]|nr:hypothetical protein [Lactococcus lactis]